jgi:hypothetical protein
MHLFAEYCCALCIIYAILMIVENVQKYMIIVSIKESKFEEKLLI